jgi:hypothetical protein
MKWINELGGYEKLGEKLLKERKTGNLPVFVPPKVLFRKLFLVPVKSCMVHISVKEMNWKISFVLTIHYLDFRLGLNF